MPPETPTMTRLRSTARRALLLALGVFEQVAVDLAQRDGQRLFLQPGLDQRTNVFEDALAELVVVVVDLPRPLGRVDHEGVFTRDTVQQFIDGWVGDPERGVVSALST